MVFGGLLQNLFSRLDESTRDLALESPLAYEVTLRVAHGCHFEPAVGQERYGRANTEALDEATGSAGRHSTPLRGGTVLLRSWRIPCHTYKATIMNDDMYNSTAIAYFHTEQFFAYVYGVSRDIMEIVHSAQSVNVLIEHCCVLAIVRRDFNWLAPLVGASCAH